MLGQRKIPTQLNGTSNARAHGASSTTTIEDSSTCGMSGDGAGRRGVVLGHGAAFLGHAASLLGSGPKEELADLRVPEPLRPVRCGRAARVLEVGACAHLEELCNGVDVASERCHHQRRHLAWIAAIVVEAGSAAHEEVDGPQVALIRSTVERRVAGAI